MITIHLEIKGKVQGVFFRANARRIAEKNNLKGWIKNKSNGNVESVVTGMKEDVDTFVEWCRKGPDKALVEEVVIITMETVFFEEFEVKG